MATIESKVQWSDNTADLAQNLRNGITSLEAMKTAADKVATALGGDGLFRQANAAATAITEIGGVTKLTSAEQDKYSAILDKAIAKYQAMGVSVPAAVQNIATALDKSDKSLLTTVSDFLEGIPIIGQFFGAMAVEKLVEFALDAEASAGRIADLATATGLSADALQRLSYVGQEFGVDTETMARGVEQLSEKLATGDSNATKAVEMLGLNVQALLNLGPQEAFLRIADAAGSVSDPMTKGAIAADLFGQRLGKQLLPSLSDLRDKMAAVPQSAIISDENIQKAKNFDTGLSHLVTTLKAWTVGALVVPGNVLTGLEYGLGLIKQTNTETAKTPAVVKPTIDANQAWANMLDALAQKHDALNGALAAQIVADADLGVATKDLAAHYNVSEQAVTDLIATHKKFTDAMTELTSAGVGLQGTIATLDASVVEAIKYYLDAGVAQDKLASAYGLTAAQVKAVATEYTNEKQALAELVKLNADYAATAISQSGTQTEIEVANINRKFETQKAQLQATNKLSDDVAAALARNWQQALDSVGVNWDELKGKSYQDLQDQVDRAQATLDEMLTGDKTYTQAAIDDAKQRLQAAQDELRGISTAHAQAVTGWAADQAKWSALIDGEIGQVHTLAGEWVKAEDAKKSFEGGNSITYDLSTDAGLNFYKTANPAATFSWADQKVEDFVKAGGTLAQLIQLGAINPYGKYANVPGFATGVENFSGGLALVGEQGPELVDLPGGSSVHPGALSGGLTVNVNVQGVIDAQGKRMLAGLVTSEITRELKQNRLLPSF